MPSSMLHHAEKGIREKTRVLSEPLAFAGNCDQLEPMSGTPQADRGYWRFADLERAVQPPAYVGTSRETDPSFSRIGILDQGSARIGDNIDRRWATRPASRTGGVGFRPPGGARTTARRRRRLNGKSGGVRPRSPFTLGLPLSSRSS